MIRRVFRITTSAIRASNFTSVKDNLSFFGKYPQAFPIVSAHKMVYNSGEE